MHPLCNGDWSARIAALEEIVGEEQITIEKEVNWKNRNKSLYFRDPVGNLVELMTP